MPAHRANARAGPAQVAAQQQQVGDHVDGRHRMLVLGDAHAPAGNHTPGVEINLASLAQRRFVQTGLFDDGVPTFGMHIGSERFEIGGVRGDEFQIQQARHTIALRLRIALQHMLDDALHRGQVAADLELEIIRRDARGAVVQHLQLVLRSANFSSPRSRSGLNAAIAAPRFEA